MGFFRAGKKILEAKIKKKEEEESSPAGEDAEERGKNRSSCQPLMPIGEAIERRNQVIKIIIVSNNLL